MVSEHLVKKASLESIKRGDQLSTENAASTEIPEMATVVAPALARVLPVEPGQLVSQYEIQNIDGIGDSGAVKIRSTDIPYQFGLVKYKNRDNHRYIYGFKVFRDGVNMFCRTWLYGPRQGLMTTQLRNGCSHCRGTRMSVPPLGSFRMRPRKRPSITRVIRVSRRSFGPCLQNSPQHGRIRR